MRRSVIDLSISLLDIILSPPPSTRCREVAASAAIYGDYCYRLTVGGNNTSDNLSGYSVAMGQQEDEPAEYSVTCKI